MTRQPDFSSSKHPARATAWQSLGLGVCVLVAFASAISAYLTRGEAESARRRLAEVRRDVDAAATRVKALESHARAGRAGMLAPEDAPPARILSDVAALLPGNVRLERIAIDYRGGGTLELAVVARDASAWDLLLQRLALAEHLRAVTPGPEARAAEVRSVVRARWGSEPR